MFQLIKDSIFAFHFRRAVRKADHLHHLTHRKYMVLVINKQPSNSLLAYVYH